MTTRLSKKAAGDLVDKLGLVLAQMAPLKIEEKSIKETLGAYTNGSGDVDGEFFHSNVTTSYRDKIEYSMVVAKLKSYMTPRAFASFMKAVTSETTVVTVRCTAHLASPKQNKAA